MKRTLDQRIAAKREHKARLAAQLAALEGRQKVADRKRDTRRKIVVGAAVLTEMERTPRFAAFVRGMLAKAVTRPQDRNAIADLLSAAAELTTPSANGAVPPATPDMNGSHGQAPTITGPEPGTD